MERILLRASKERTGSRLGVVGRMEVYSVVGRVPGGGYRMGRYGSGDQLFPDKYWKPVDYWVWQDRTLNPRGAGHVDVGPAQSVETGIQGSGESE